MIELNCSYEESKKIFDLGYDFSKICTIFTYAAKVSFFKIPMTNNVYTDGMKFYEEGSVEGFVPIIPKAALEACLPDIVDAYHGDLIWYTPRNPPEYRLCRDGDSVTSLLLEEFDSIYEAFIWCHENHPEELKKKFEEVMK